MMLPHFPYYDLYFDFDCAGPIPPLPFLGCKNGLCYVCVQRTLWQCYQENPKWFSPKKHRPIARHWAKVDAYVLEKTPEQKCLEIAHVLDYDTEYESTETYMLCKEHLTEVLQNLGMD